MGVLNNNEKFCTFDNTLGHKVLKLRVDFFVASRSRRPVSYTHQQIFFMALQPPSGPGRVIGPTQRPQPDETKQPQETVRHASGGIQTHNPSTRAAAEQRLGPCGHWDRETNAYILEIQDRAQNPWRMCNELTLYISTRVSCNDMSRPTWLCWLHYSLMYKHTTLKWNWIWRNLKSGLVTKNTADGGFLIAHQGCRYFLQATVNVSKRPAGHSSQHNITQHGMLPQHPTCTTKLICDYF